MKVLKITPYNDEWPSLFTQEELDLKELMGSNLTQVQRPEPLKP
ncbi:MAG: hypothetical protein ABFQ95_07405 [Pseudomonadota bacterium]